MNVETLLTILIVAIVVTTIVRLFAGWSIAAWLLTLVLALLGGIGGWQAAQRLALPAIYSMPFPDGTPVSVVWASLGALLLALIGGLIGRPSQRRPARRRYR